jgi:hypothetical protein
MELTLGPHQLAAVGEFLAQCHGRTSLVSLAKLHHELLNSDTRPNLCVLPYIGLMVGTTHRLHAGTPLVTGSQFAARSDLRQDSVVLCGCFIGPSLILVLIRGAAGLLITT